MVWTLASAATTLRGWDSGLYECKASAEGDGRRLYVIMTPAGPADGGGGGSSAAAEPRVDVTVTDGDEGWSGMLIPTKLQGFGELLEPPDNSNASVLAAVQGLSPYAEAVLDTTGVTPTLRWERLYGSEAEGFSRLQIGVLELARDPDAAAVIRRKMGGLAGQVASLRAKRRRIISTQTGLLAEVVTFKKTKSELERERTEYRKDVLSEMVDQLNAAKQEAKARETGDDDDESQLNESMSQDPVPDAEPAALSLAGPAAPAAADTLAAAASASSVVAAVAESDSDSDGYL